MAASYSHFGIVGAGGWGTALAVMLRRAGRDVTLWTRMPDRAATMDVARQNAIYLPDVQLDTGLRVTAKLADLTSCDVLILATPAQYVRQICINLVPFCTAPKPVVIAAKGVELGTHRLMSEVVAEILPQHSLFVLSGPSFAHEVAQGLPAALTLASEVGGEALAAAINAPSFRLYTTDDMIGTQLGGAIKNVLAIACGIAAGRQLGANAQAALITRGLAEIMRLGTALGARMETLMGLSGLGDIVLTCSSVQSRNMSLGMALGHGQRLQDILAARTGVTEGIATATAALGLAYRHGIDMPVVSAVDRVLREQASIDTVIASLLARPLRHESA